jgi:hypothetical protein
VTPEVLSFTIPTFDLSLPTRRYPSVNGMWAQGVRRGRKTPEYHYLFGAVRDAARVEMERVGWVTAVGRVEVHLRRYMVTLLGADPSNLAKCELDAMAPARAGEDPFPGVYANDRLVRPFPDIVYDPAPDAVDRIAIAVFRLPVPPLADAGPRTRRKAPAAESPPLRATRPTGQQEAPKSRIRTWEQIEADGPGTTLSTAEFAAYKDRILAGAGAAPRRKV